MRTKFFLPVVAASTMLVASYAAPVRATLSICSDIFQNKFEGELALPPNGSPIGCAVAGKASVEPKDGCFSQICLSVHDVNNFVVVGPILEVEVLSFCTDGGADFGPTAGSPAVASGPLPEVNSLCLAGAGLSSLTDPVGPEGPDGPLYGEAAGKIKIECEDDVAKTKGDFEYRCTVVD